MVIVVQVVSSRQISSPPNRKHLFLFEGEVSPHVILLLIRSDAACGGRPAIARDELSLTTYVETAALRRPI